MRTESLLLVALSMIVSCTNVTESAQNQNATGGGASDSVGGNSGNSVGGTTARSASQAPIDSDGGTNQDAPTGGAKSASSTSAPSTKSAGGSSSNPENTEEGGASDTGGTNSLGGAKSSGGANSSGGAKNIAGAKATGGAKNTSGPKSTGGTKNTSGPKSTGGSPGDGGSSSGSGGSSPNATAAVGCDRAGLEAATKAYLSAVEAGDSTKMPLASSAKYTEVATIKGSTTDFAGGLWKTALPVKFSRSLLDVTGCETFTEVFVTDGGHPYVIGTRLAVKDGTITEVYSIVTDSDDWNFDATAYATCSESEDWSVLPEASRSTREQLIAAGQAYFDIFSKKDTVVPWGNPCYRLEGGKGCTPAMDKASTSCNVGIPDGITFKNTHWVVDVDLGAVVGITLFGGANPDTHLFRLVGGKIRYVHTLTVMK